MATSDLLSHLKHMIWLVEVELKEDGGHIVANAKAAVAEAEAKTQPAKSPEMNTRELEFLEIVARHRDTMDKIIKRVERLESKSVMTEVIGFQ